MPGMTAALRTEGSLHVLQTSTHRFAVDAAGGRIVEYALAGRNVVSMAGDRVQQGSTFWMAPQSAWPEIWPPSAALEVEPYEVERDGDAWVMRSPPVAELGVRVHKRFRMRPDGSVHVAYEVLALREGVAWSPWEVTRLRPGLCFFATGRPTELAETHVARIEAKVDGEVTWVPFAAGNDRFASLLADGAGWCGHARDGLLLLKSFPTVEPARYAPGNASIKVWWQNSEFIELEQIGAFEVLSPERPCSYEVVWKLVGLGPDVEIAAGSPSLRRHLPR